MYPRNRNQPGCKITLNKKTTTCMLFKMDRSASASAGAFTISCDKFNVKSTNKSEIPFYFEANALIM